MELWLIGRNGDFVKTWEKELKGVDGVFTVSGDILELAENIIVSPAGLGSNVGHLASV